MSERGVAAQSSVGRPRRGAERRACSVPADPTARPTRANAPHPGAQRIGPASRPRGYRVDYHKLKTLCRQAGLKMIDLYEPGVLPRQLMSEGTFKNLRKGGRASIDMLLRIAEALSGRLHWHVDWRDLIEREFAADSLHHRLAVLSFDPPVSDADGADGFHASIVAQLLKLRGLRVVSVPAPAATAENVAIEADAMLNGAVRTCGELARLDVAMIDARTREVLWANSYPFAVSDRLRAEAAIAAEVADQIGRALAAA